MEKKDAGRDAFQLTLDLGLGRQGALLRAIHNAEVAYYESGRASSWGHSDWRWLLRIPPLPKSRYVAGILQEVLREEGLQVELAGGIETVFKILDAAGRTRRVPVKFSMAGERDSVFRIQQVRANSGDQVLFLGVTPWAEYLWLIPTGVLRRIGTNEHGSPVEKWLVFRPEDPPLIIAPYGGTFEEGIERVLRVYSR